MHRPLIILVCFVLFGLGMFAFTGGFTPVDQQGPRTGVVDAGTGARQSIIEDVPEVAVAPEVAEDANTDDVATLDPDLDADAPAVIPQDTVAPSLADITPEVLPEALNDAPVAADIAVEAPQTPVTPEFDVAMAPAAPEIEVPEASDVLDIATASPSFTVAPQPQIELSAPSVTTSIGAAPAPAPQVDVLEGDAAPTVVTAAPAPALAPAPLDIAPQTVTTVAAMAPAPTLDFATLPGTPAFSQDALPQVDNNPIRSRAPSALQTTVETTVSLNIPTQTAQPPVVSVRPAEEVAIFAGRSVSGDGSLLLTATALGADGVLRPSRVGSLRNITTSAPVPQATATPAPVPTVSVAPAPRPAITETPIEGVAQNVVSFLNSGALPATDTLLTTHIVRPGDTLAKMAIQYYGDRDAFTFIFEANRDVLARPEQIRVGQAIRIPVVAGFN